MNGKKAKLLRQVAAQLPRTEEILKIKKVYKAGPGLTRKKVIHEVLEKIQRPVNHLRRLKKMYRAKGEFATLVYAEKNIVNSDNLDDNIDLNKRGFAKHEKHVIDKLT